MTYAIIGSGTVGSTLASFFAAKNIPVLIANSRGPETLGDLVGRLGGSVEAATIQKAVAADVVFFAVGSLAFKEVGAVLEDWSGRIVVDLTNAFMLPQEVQAAEFGGRLTSEINAERVPRRQAREGVQSAALQGARRPAPRRRRPKGRLRLQRPSGREHDRRGPRG